VVFGDSAGGVSIKAADGTSEPKPLWSSGTTTWPLSWSPDGKLILLRVQDPKSGGLDLWIFNATDRKARPLIATPAEESDGAISPDGKWLAYSSNESGRSEIFMVPFPDLGEKRQVSTTGGAAPTWIGDKQIAFVQQPENRLLAVDVEARGASLLVGVAHPLFGGKPLLRDPLLALRRPGAVAPGGKRILLPVPIEQEASAQVRFVSDWVSGLKTK
jgi:dipeptidyl aminopeptidase/acylaminoacyl peptidase